MTARSESLPMASAPPMIYLWGGILGVNFQSPELEPETTLELHPSCYVCFLLSRLAASGLPWTATWGSSDWFRAFTMTLTLNELQWWKKNPWSYVHTSVEFCRAVPVHRQRCWGIGPRSELTPALEIAFASSSDGSPLQPSRCKKSNYHIIEKINTHSVLSWPS